MKLKKEKIFLIILLVLSLLRFFYKIQERAMFEYDQEFLAQEAKKIVVDKKLTLIGAPTSVGGMFIGPLYSYLVALVMLAFKMSPYVINYLTAFWGVATLLTIYLVCLDLFGLKPAFFASLTALFSFYLLDSIPPLVQPFALTSLLIFWALLKTARNKKYFLLAALLTGWAFNLHFSAVLFPVLILSSLFWGKVKIGVREALMMALILLVFLSPLFLFEIRHSFFMTKNLLNFLGENSGARQGFFSGFKRSTVISFEHLASLIAFNHLPLQLGVVLFALVFVFYLLWAKKKKLSKAFLIWVFAPILIFSFYTGHIIPYYFTLQEVILFPILGLFFATLWKRKPLRILVILFFLVFIKENFYLWLSWQTSRSLRNKIQALEFIKKDSAAQSIYLSYTMEPGIDGGFGYLEWYLKINKKEDKNLPIYTLIAPFDWQNIKPDYTFGDYGVKLPRLF